jgi:hypothetical protein
MSIWKFLASNSQLAVTRATGNFEFFVFCSKAAPMAWRLTTAV